MGLWTESRPQERHYSVWRNIFTCSTFSTFHLPSNYSAASLRLLWCTAQPAGGPLIITQTPPLYSSASSSVFYIYLRPRIPLHSSTNVTAHPSTQLLSNAYMHTGIGLLTQFPPTPPDFYRRPSRKIWNNSTAAVIAGPSTSRYDSGYFSRTSKIIIFGLARLFQIFAHKWTERTGPFYPRQFQMLQLMLATFTFTTHFCTQVMTAAEPMLAGLCVIFRRLQSNYLTLGSAQRYYVFV